MAAPAQDLFHSYFPVDYPTHQRLEYQATVLEEQ